MKKICASILNVAVEERIDVIKQLLNIGVNHLHIDVMDGVFVPNIAITVEEIKSFVNLFPQLVIDVHLMVQNPKAFLEIMPKVDYVTVHFESCTPSLIYEFLQQKSWDFKIGLAIKPQTSVYDIQEFLPYVSLILIMSVEPGWGGQVFNSSSLEKVRQLFEIRTQQNFSFIIQVDGGINELTAPLAFRSGADWLVCGTYLVKNISPETIKKLLFPLE